MCTDEEEPEVALRGSLALQAGGIWGTCGSCIWTR